MDKVSSISPVGSQFFCKGAGFVSFFPFHLKLKAKMDRRLMNTSYLSGQLQKLHSLHRRTIQDYAELVVALNEECEVLIDLIPNYKISPNQNQAAEEEDGEGPKQPRMKKEVAAVDKLEHELLTQYERFLQLLRKLHGKHHPEQQALGSRLCSKLVKAACEFNHNETLLTLAVDFANAKSSRVAQPCLTALQELLDSELVSDPALFVVNGILSIVRKKHHAINPKVLNLLLFIRVAMLDIHRKDIAEEMEKNKRMKKQDKELARQMMKAKARRDRAELAVKQTKIIEKIFVVYLRVLRGAQTCANQLHQTKVLAPTLEGLSKFAPLVNVEHFHLLMAALKELVDDEKTSVSTKLHALVAVSCLAQKDATYDSSEWRVDQSHYHNVLFKCLRESLSCPAGDRRATGQEEEGSSDNKSQGSVGSIGTLSSQAFSIAQSMAQQHFVKSSAGKEWTYQVSVAIRAIDLLILTQRHVPIPRIVALIRRLLQFAPHTPHHISLSLLSLAHRIAVRYPSAASIFIGGSDHQFSGRGTFDPEVDDVNHCNAESSFGWELPLLAHSYHPVLRDVSGAICRHYHKVGKQADGAPAVVSSSLNALHPLQLLEKYDCSQGDVVPHPPQPSSRRRKRAREEEEE